MTWTAGAGLAILGLTLIALFKGYEVRLVLLLAAIALAALTQQVEKVGITFFQGLADATSIIPICSAMGFAFVLKAFECDKHLVEALSRPLLYAKWLVVPGTILIGFVVNITIISQTSTSLAAPAVTPAAKPSTFRRDAPPAREPPTVPPSPGARRTTALAADTESGGRVGSVG